MHNLRLSFNEGECEENTYRVTKINENRLVGTIDIETSQAKEHFLQWYIPKGMPGLNNTAILQRSLL